MIEENEHGGFDVHCDECSYADWIDEESWSDMIAAIKSDGWRIYKERGEWLHECPACAQDRA